MFDALRRHVQHTLRRCLKAPLTAATMIVCIALGIGPGLAIFGVVDAILFKTLPVTEPDQLVAVIRQSGAEAAEGFPYPFFELARQSAKTLQATAAWSATKVSTRIQDRSAPLTAELVSANYFSALGVPMAVGAAWQTTQDARGVVVSHRYWTRALGGDPSILGRAITIQGEQLSVIGVATPEFFGMQVGTFVDVWLPIELAPALRGRPNMLAAHTQWWVNIVGRRRAETSVAQASQELGSMFKSYRRSVAGDTPSADRLAEIERDTARVIDASRGTSRIGAERRRMLSWMVIISVCILMLVLSALATVLLGTLVQRGAELATKLSVGASTRALYGEITIEQTLLVSAGTLLGVAVWYWMRPFLPRLLFGPTIQLDLSGSWRLVVMGAAAALFVTLALASIAMQWIVRRDLMALLGPTGMSAGVARGRASQRWHHAVLFVQAGLSVAMVLEASAFARSFANVAGRDLGFDTHDIVVARLDVRNASLTPEAVVQLQQYVLERARAWPGTKAASLSWTAPLDSAREVFDEIGMTAGGQPCTVKHVDLQVVERDYFAVLGIPFAEGGAPPPGLAGSDGGSLKGVVNETFARRCAGSGSMIGRTNEARGRPGIAIVGVVKNVQYHSLKGKTGAVMYMPADRWPSDSLPSLTLLVRTDQPLAVVASTIRSDVRRFNAEIGLGEITTMAAQIQELSAPERTLAQTTRLTTLLGLLLVAVGIYGSVNQRVTERLGEFALRLALGAHLRQVIWMCVRSLAIVLIVGAAAGYLLSVPIRSVTRSLLFGTIDEGAGTALLAVLTVLVVGAAAAALPLLRLKRFDLVTNLRQN